MVWLEGDNPFNSTDSRSYGPVPLALVKGLVSFKVRASPIIVPLDRHGSTHPSPTPLNPRPCYPIITIHVQLYPLHEFGPVPRTYRRPGVTYPRLDYESGITR